MLERRCITVCIPLKQRHQLWVQMWDLEHTEEPVYTAKAHASIINQIDGTGGQASSMAFNSGWCIIAEHVLSIHSALYNAYSHAGDCGIEAWSANGKPAYYACSLNCYLSLHRYCAQFWTFVVRSKRALMLQLSLADL